MLKTKIEAASFSLLLQGVTLAQGLGINVIDLTHPVSENTVAWPSASKFQLSNVFAGDSGHGYYYEGRDFSQAEHSGTHTDAPAHFCRDRWHAADIPMDHLVAPGVKVSIKDRAEIDQDTMLTVQDLLDWEESNGRIPDKSVVLVHTGRGRLYEEKEKYLGRPKGMDLEETDTEHLHFPGVSPEAAAWLVDNRAIVGLGIDTPSTDRGQSKTFKTHQVICKSNTWGLENVANSDKLPTRGFIIYNLVHKLSGGSGGPTRVVAVLDPVNGSGRPSAVFSLLWSLAFIVAWYHPDP